jgi:hypothetical protein
MEPAWLYTADFLAAASEMASSDETVKQAIREAQASADVTFPDGSLLILGLPNIERNLPLHAALWAHAREEAFRNDYHFLHLHQVFLYTNEKLGNHVITVNFWNIQWSGREPAESFITFRHARDMSRLKLMVSFFKRLKPDVVASIADRVRRLVDSLAERGIGGEQGIRSVSPVELSGPKEIHFTIDASSTGFCTMIWLGYQLYLLRDIWPVEDVMDERTATGVTIAGNAKTRARVVWPNEDKQDAPQTDTNQK